MIFEDWKYNYSLVDDGAEVWVWAEFYFRDEEGLLEGRSPVYVKGASDYHCLEEDTLRVVRELRSGKTWEDVCRTFREAW